MASTTHEITRVIPRLFDHRDIEFVRAMRGYSTRAESEFRRRRCRIFLAYLRSLKAEVLEARIEMETLGIESPADDRPRSRAMLRCRARFAWAMLPAYLCLFRYRWELGGAGLEPVVRRFEDIRGEIRRSIRGIC